jgi:hypothetical protein
MKPKDRRSRPNKPITSNQVLSLIDESESDSEEDETDVDSTNDEDAMNELGLHSSKT